MNSQTTISSMASKRSRKTTPTPRRTWVPEEERTLINGLKELCANGWKADNGTFRSGYLMELEHYLLKYHPGCGLKGEPHVNSKLRAWKRNYASIALLKNRSGLGFQHSDGTIIVDDPKAWDDFVKIDPNAKTMNTKKWPLFKDWEEIFGKDRATGEFAEGPLDAAEEIQRSQDIGFSSDMTLGFPIDIDNEEEDDASHGPNVATGEAENIHTEHSSFTGASENECPGASENEYCGYQQTHKPDEHTKRSFTNVNEKEKCKKRKATVENDSDAFLKGMVDILKQFTESQDKRMGALIDKIGVRDQSEIRAQVYSILESSAFELYTMEQRFKAAMVLCEDIKKMELFIRMGELKRQTMMWMIVNGKL